MGSMVQGVQGSRPWCVTTELTTSRGALRINPAPKKVLFAAPERERFEQQKTRRRR